MPATILPSIGSLAQVDNVDGRVAIMNRALFSALSAYSPSVECPFSEKMTNKQS